MRESIRLATGGAGRTACAVREGGDRRVERKLHPDWGGVQAAHSSAELAQPACRDPAGPRAGKTAHAVPGLRLGGRGPGPWAGQYARRRAAASALPPDSSDVDPCPPGRGADRMDRTPAQSCRSLPARCLGAFSGRPRRCATARGCLRAVLQAVRPWNGVDRHLSGAGLFRPGDRRTRCCIRGAPDPDDSSPRRPPCRSGSRVSLTPGKSARDAPGPARPSHRTRSPAHSGCRPMRWCIQRHGAPLGQPCRVNTGLPAWGPATGGTARPCGGLPKADPACCAGVYPGREPSGSRKNVLTQGG